jgi:hypothetical protein
MRVCDKCDSEDGEKAMGGKNSNNNDKKGNRQLTAHGPGGRLIELLGCLCNAANETPRRRLPKTAACHCARLYNLMIFVLGRGCWLGGSFILFYFILYRQFPLALALLSLLSGGCPPLAP